MSDYYLAIISFIAVAALIPLAARLAEFVGLLDQPDKRKVHDGAIPLVGGLVIFPVFVAVSVLSGIDLKTHWTLFTGITFLLVIGGLDDRFEISAWLRFSIQLFVSFLVVLEGPLRIDHLGNIFSLGTFELGFMAIPFSVAAVMLLINAINLIDGVDGLAGGVSFAIVMLLVIFAFAGGVSSYAFFFMPMAGALLGFLVYNMRHPFREKAAVFMGDAGSLSLGLTIAWFAITIAKDPNAGVAPISIAWVLAVPIMDECAQFYRRVREGRHPFSPDRGHFHHHFLDSGFSPAKTTILILSLVLILGVLGYVSLKAGVPQLIVTSLWIFCLLSHMFVSEKPHRYVRFFKNLRTHLYKSA